MYAQLVLNSQSKLLYNNTSYHAIYNYIHGLLNNTVYSLRFISITVRNEREIQFMSSNLKKQLERGFTRA